MAKKVVISVLLATLVSALVAASFIADAFDGFDALNPLGWLFPLLMLTGIGTVVAVAVRLARS